MVAVVSTRNRTASLTLRGSPLGVGAIAIVAIGIVTLAGLENAFGCDERKLAMTPRWGPAGTWGLNERHVL